MSTPEIEYENRLVAFIDILGFKEIVKQSEIDKSKIEFLYSALEFLKNWEVPEKWDLTLIEIEEDAQKRGVENFEIRGKTNCTSFSDSIVVSVKVGENNINEISSTLITNLGYIGAILLEKGILIRGGLTIGNLIHNDNGIVFGQGLIDSYKLESKNAKFPRIILSDKLIKELNYPLTTKRNRYPYHQYIDRFDDGCVGFHQLQYFEVIQSWENISTKTLTQKLDNVRNIIIRGLDNSFERIDVFEKYNWLKQEYQKLSILVSYDNHGIAEGEKIKKNFSELNTGISRHNIHFSYPEDYLNSKSRES